MDKVHFVGCKSANFSQSQLDAVKALVDGAPILLGVNVYPNLDTSNDEDIPTGVALFFPPSAPVDSTLISDNLFQIVTVTKINGAALTDDAFANVARLNDAVRQHPESPASDAIRHPSANKDKRTWEPELGGMGSFAGIYYQLRENHRDKDYFVIARGTVPMVVRDLKRDLARANSTTTYRDLLVGQEWHGRMRNASNMAERNALRVSSNVAEAYGVGVTRINDYAHLDEPHFAQPECAVPDWQQNTHSIRSTMFRGQPAAVMYSGVVPKEDCQLLEGNRFFVVGNPYDGVYAFPLSEGSATVSVPADTGRKVMDTATANNTPPESAAKCVTWEQQTQTPSHPDLCTGSFNKLTPSIKSLMRQVGWNAEHHVGIMVPLALKLYNPEMKRKVRA